MWTDILDDPKLLLLAPDDRWYFVAVCALKRRGLLDEGDDLVTRDRKIALSLRLDHRERDEMKRRLIEVKLIDEDWQPHGWKNRQFSSDSSVERTRKWRKKKKRHCDVTETTPQRHSDCPETEQSRAEKEIGQSGFDRWYSAYPKKVKRKTAEQIWKRKRLEEKADELLADIGKRRLEDARWLGGYIPDPPTYLNQERWNDEIQRSRHADRGVVV